MAFVDKLKEAKTELEEAGFGDLPILMTEWNTQAHGPDWKAKWVGNENVSNLFAGAAVCHLSTACDDLVDAFGWWVASDVFEEGGPHFEPYGTGNQYYGMLNVNGVPKAAFHGFSFLNRMRGARYAPSFAEPVQPTRSVMATDEDPLPRMELPVSPCGGDAVGMRTVLAGSQITSGQGRAPPDHSHGSRRSGQCLRILEGNGLPAGPHTV